jgi:hypothetical protein
MNNQNFLYFSPLKEKPGLLYTLNGLCELIKLRKAVASGHWQELQLKLQSPVHALPENPVLLVDNISHMQETLMYLILSFTSIQHGEASKELK